MFQLSEEVGSTPTSSSLAAITCSGSMRPTCATRGSSVPKKYLVGLGSYALALRRLGRMADRLPLERPWDADDAGELDARTLADWLSSRSTCPGLGRELAPMTMQVLFCTDPAELSGLGALVLARGGHSHGGFEYYAESSLTETHLLDGGPPAVADRLAAGPRRSGPPRPARTTHHPRRPWGRGAHRRSRRRRRASRRGHASGARRPHRARAGPSARPPAPADAHGPRRGDPRDHHLPRAVLA